MAPRALGQAQHLRADSDAPLIQRFDGDLVAFARLAQHVLFWNQAVVEDQLAGAAGANPQLVFLAAHGEARRALLNQKCGDAAVTGRRIECGEDDKQARLARIADP